MISPCQRFLMIGLSYDHEIFRKVASYSMLQLPWIRFLKIYFFAFLFQNLRFLCTRPPGESMEGADSNYVNFICM